MIRRWALATGVVLAVLLTATACSGESEDPCGDSQAAERADEPVPAGDPVVAGEPVLTAQLLAKSGKGSKGSKGRRVVHHHSNSNSSSGRSDGCGVPSPSPSVSLTPRIPAAPTKR
ncbi:hypothetical protein GCM10010193_32780 [Kitasatospora atroaurantiaca]|uniref:Secreted protein n=1 Tax=Kitasatospora atroaurantiaca TaxID=285545 RepID=A0A561ERM0_9ACTN|nr:hypothetical protein [Kitasatospora atroaurantiaca]TWE18260.1 hypothetical protein FB465_3314 [Kitasatospora atroaurantiaca]